ncbi:MAG: chlorite dismutase family protein [Chloroflexi bacterium]|nr:chlorite dismutase family protein [Chloroflexota bacterium]
MTDETGKQQVVRFAFYKVDPLWRRLPPEQRWGDKEEFARVFTEAATEHLLRSYSTMGTRGDVDFLIWMVAWDLETIRCLSARLLDTGLGRYLTTPFSYLSMTRRSLYVKHHRHEGQEGTRTRIVPGEKKYLFVYPFTKTHEWYQLSQRVRQAMMNEHIVIGHKYPGVKINTTYSYGLDDHEFVVAFEADDPAEFMNCVEELRFADARPYTAIDTPIFTCLRGSIEETLAYLGG